MIANAFPVAPFTVRTESGDEVAFQTIIRELPNERFSGFASWRGKPVFAKFFTGRRAERHWRREDAGVRALIGSGIVTPALLYSGKAARGYVVICERLVGAATCRDLWESATSDDARRDLLRMLSRVLARHHDAGVRQTDPHWNNFICAHAVVYTLDGAAIAKGEVSDRKALDNLALFFAQIAPAFDPLVPEAYREYAKVRGRDLRHSSELEVRIGSARGKRKKRYLRKIFRNSTAFRCESGFRLFTVYDRSFDTKAFRALLGDIDSVFSERLLKDGNSSTVARVSIDSQEIVVKRNNLKSIRHALRRMLRTTRAARSWRNGQLLKFCGIGTAKPVALIERRFGPLRGTSYFISEYVDGPNVRDHVAAHPEDAEGVVAELVALLRSLKSQSLNHGDLKASNIVVKDDGLVLLDLDAMREHRFEAALRRAIRRDAQRLLANWEQATAMHSLLKKRLAEFF